MRIRLKYAKEGIAKYISHLDLIRAFERALRRAKLPMAFTQGFNPRPKMSFAAALPVGATSVSEYMDVEFTSDLPPETVVEKLNSTLPRGLKILDAYNLGEGFLKLSDLNAGIYRVQVALNNGDEADLRQGIADLLVSEEIIIEKKSKGKVRQVNIAPLIHDIEIAEIQPGSATLTMVLSMGQKGSVAPETVVSEINKLMTCEIQMKGFCRREMFVKKEEERILPIKSQS